MPENTVISPFLGTFMTAIFIFSTIYTLAFFYTQGANTQLQIQNNPEYGKFTNDANDPTATNAGSTGVFGFFIGVADGVLEFISWISPFALVKQIIIEVTTNTPELYTVLNLLILRPVSWITSIFTVNYIISRIPTEHGEV